MRDKTDHLHYILYHFGVNAYFIMVVYTDVSNSLGRKWRFGEWIEGRTTASRTFFREQTSITGDLGRISPKYWVLSKLSVQLYNCPSWWDGNDKYDFIWLNNKNITCKDKMNKGFGLRQWKTHTVWFHSYVESKRKEMNKRKQK